MRKITIATHCWAKKLPQYAVFLRAQLSSLVLHHPRYTEVSHITICEASDTDTINVLSDFAQYDTPIQLSAIVLKPQQVWRRAIGRNLVAERDVDSDLIWYTDCDYLFGDGCIDMLFEKWEERDRPEMLWPKWFLVNETKEPIDQFWKDSVGHRGMIMPDISNFILQKCPRAIGGVQIVRGDWLRERGFLPNTKWQDAPDEPFPDCRDDVAFREWLRKVGGRYRWTEPLTGLYRMRHTEVGYGVGLYRERKNVVG